MSIIAEQIDKALRRLDFDLATRIQLLQNRTPKDVATPTERLQRLQFLTESLGDEEIAVDTLERVLAGNELQLVNYLERGAIAARAVARIQIRQPNGKFYGWGTSFLIAPQVLITNNHVLPSIDWAVNSSAQFNYEIDLHDRPIGPVEFTLTPQELFYTSPNLDFTIVAVAETSTDGTERLERFGWLPLLDTPGKSLEGEWLTIVQHPSGERKQLCVRENRLIKRSDDVLWYSTDTLGGSSGSPVHNNDWFVVALHHSGIPERHEGKIQTIDGQDFNPRTMDESRIKWIANEGIRASRIVQTLKQFLPVHPLLQPLFNITPESARIIGSDRDSFVPDIKPVDPMTQDNNIQTVTIPLQITLQINANGEVMGAGTPSNQLASARESDLSGLERRGDSRTTTAKFDAPFDPNYDNRKGYNPDFLGTKYHIGLPKLSPGLEVEATELISPSENNRYILHYNNFSVVMHRKRRFAIYSAANVSFGNRFEMSRPRDVWRLDPRIPQDAQIGEFYYAKNQFDRGHLTRREDLEFGDTPQTALASAGDTCHFTNCTPQHSGFNQSIQIWQGIERHILEDAIIAGRYNAQIFTGPIFDDSDPEYKRVPYPLQYWKIAAAIDSDGKLFATAYLASQADVIARLGIEADIPFAPFKTFQVKISEIERLTGLTFVYGKDEQPLKKCDPLETARVNRRRRFSPNESTAIDFFSSAYIELTELDDILM
ncbi:DNA/RNA non-specific endonuclease [Dendronalium sp. ChiSLP03b]|uniref:DNA/RNA non-specific endonuclease n=1 Tax=Dendronalium sp. ChiSLP03b TaxID=3075381 RepID=UPI002AD41E1D|nr:DNA/RNA non-specific endonuclease [Dendronalium sp. ChiSLP03b]MDZ8208359.1 DNA/RNA non-specific endonuclease [Dendronalium sp. ChiSLP03b]